MDTLLLGLSLGLGAGLAPGPLLALVVAATLERGFAAGARIAAAPLLSDAPIVLLCVLVLRELPQGVVDGLSLAGGLFVAWLAWEAWRGAATSSGTTSDLRRAVLVNALSPHPWLFWLTVGGPLVVDAGDRSPWLALAFLGGFYGTLVGAKVALARVVAALPRSRRGEGGRGARLVSAALLAGAAVALLAGAVS